MPEPPEAPRVVVFDLDYTLIRCDSFAQFCRELLLARWWRLGLAVASLPVIAALMSRRTTRVHALSSLVWFATVGRDPAELDRLMDEYVDRHFAKSTTLRCLPAISALLEQHRGDARVVVATGCTAALARRICDALGIQVALIVGSTLRPWRGGWVADQHCIGRNKVAMLLASGVGDAWDVAYTDSAADIPLLSRARHRVLVNPKPAHRTRIAGVLGPAFDVLEG